MAEGSEKDPWTRVSDARWRALLRRDAGALGAFWYGVRTTGVYCVVGCPSRPPKRENVVFFDSPGEAEREGYRACKRCRPNQPRPGEERLDRIRQACDALAHNDRSTAIARARRICGMSESTFRRVFTSAVGVSPKQYQLAVRRFGRAGSHSGVKARSARRGSRERPRDDALRLRGATAASLRRGVPGETIRYAGAGCALGRVLVALSVRGVCGIALGDRDDQLVEELVARFPLADLVRDPTLSEYLAAVVAMIDRPSIGCGLPLDVRGTAFQHKVWEHLRSIPPGTTVTYAGVAKAIGRPGSARAVARACASNPIAVAVPCHRVVGSDGRLTGFRWGVERKAALLEAERRGDA